MFEKEAEEWFKDKYRTTSVLGNKSIKNAYQQGAEFGYNMGYHDAEEHYMSVIDSQHKLVDESKKEDFKNCMKCTDNTYQYGFKDGYNKANEWHYVKDGDLPPLRKEVLWCVDKQLWLGELLESRIDFGEWELDRILFNGYEIAWKEIVLPEL